MMSPPAPDNRLPRLLLLSRAALAWERLWPALWPALSIAAMFIFLATNADAGDLPLECTALISKLHQCSEHLAAIRSPVTEQFELSAEETRHNLLQANASQSLGAKCAASLKEHAASFIQLGC